MYLDSVPFLVLAALTPPISAVGNPDGITLFHRQASSTAATPTTLTSATSTPDEIGEPFNFTLDGKIFPPIIDVDGVKV